APEATPLSPLCFTADGAQLLCAGGETEALYLFDLRLLRQELAELGLDWDAPPYPPASPGAPPGPLEVEFTGVKRATQAVRPRADSMESVTLGLWANPFDAEAYFERGRLHFA